MKANKAKIIIHFFFDIFQLYGLFELINFENSAIIVAIPMKFTQSDIGVVSRSIKLVNGCD